MASRWGTPLSSNIATQFLGGSNFAYYGFGAGTGGLANTQSVRNISVTATPEIGARPSLAHVFVAPFADHIGQERDPGAQDEREPRVLHRGLVGRRDHPRVRDHGDIGKLVGSLEALMTGSMVVVSALLPSNALTSTGTRWRR